MCSSNGAEQAEEEEEDPFIKDTQDLMNSMQMSSPSWNPDRDTDDVAGSSASYAPDSGAAVAGASRSYANAGMQQPRNTGSSAQPTSNQSDPAKASSTNGTGRSYTATFGARSPTTNGSQLDKEPVVEMVQFDSGTSRSDLADAAAVRQNGASRP